MIFSWEISKKIRICWWWFSLFQKEMGICSQESGMPDSSRGQLGTPNVQALHFWLIAFFLLFMVHAFTFYFSLFLFYLLPFIIVPFPLLNNSAQFFPYSPSFSFLLLFLPYACFCLKHLGSFSCLFLQPDGLSAVTTSCFPCINTASLSPEQILGQSRPGAGC